MPRRTNKFQRLVALIETSVKRPGAKVTESKLLLDKITGQKREVDIVVETNDGIHPFTVGIECIDRSRPAAVNWVEEMHGKHLSLPTDKLILVSSSGFSAQAAKKATWLERDTLSLEQAEETDWDSIVRKINEVTVVTLLRNQPTVSVVLEVRPGTEQVSSNKFDLSNLVLFDPQDSPAPVSALVEHWLSSKTFHELEKVSVKDETRFEVPYEVPLCTGVYTLDKNGNRYSVLKLKASVQYRKEVSKVPLEQGSYKNIAVAHGSGITFGKTAQVVIAQQANSRAILNVSIEKSKG